MRREWRDAFRGGHMVNKAITRAVVLATVMSGMALGTATSASAAKEKDVFDLVCSDGVTYHVTGNGNGDFTPAREIGGSKVFIPVAFGPFTGTFTPTGGEPITVIDPPTAKGNGHLAYDLSCTFTFSGSDEHGTFEGSGSALAKVSGG